MNHLATVLLLGAAAHLPRSAPSQSPHDKAFWRAIAQSAYAVPAGESLPGLVAELSEYLASPDPELRDDIAYSTLTAWIYRQRIVPVELRRTLLAEWTANLTKDIGERDTDGVFRRSFSALSLGLLAIADNERPFLEQAEFDRLLTAALTYLEAERDVRGFDPTKGWMHSVAHTADLLKFLARSRYLQPAQQAAILAAISQKVAAVDGVLTHGEDERLARAVVAIIGREDFDEAAFRAWSPTLVPPRPTGPPTAVSLAASQNRKNLAVALYAVLSTDTRDLPSIQDARTIVLETLETLLGGAR